MKKNFSIAKIYYDLEKYESNLNGIKDSRLKKQASGTSLHQRPISSYKKNSDSRQSFVQSNLSRFQKSKLEVNSRNKNPRPSYDKQDKETKNTCFLDYTRYEGLSNKQQKLVLKQDFTYENRPQMLNSTTSSQFKKSDQLHFLTQCNKLYRLKPKQNRYSSAQEQAQSVKILLNQINKRDAVYESVTKKLGNENVEEKLKQFFEKFERMRKIIHEFKKMSKLTIQDDEELYNFLINDEQEQYEKISTNFNQQLKCE